MSKYLRIQETTGARSCCGCGQRIRTHAFVYFTKELTSQFCLGCAK